MGVEEQQDVGTASCLERASGAFLALCDLSQLATDLLDLLVRQDLRLLVAS